MYTSFRMLRNTKLFALHGIRYLRTIFFPAFCFNCTAWLSEQRALCQDCLAHIRLIGSKTISITPRYAMPVYAVGPYEDPLKRFILAKGYSDILACYYMAQLMYERYADIVEHVDYIVPIPLHRTRYARRGYNQSDETAKHLSAFSGIPVYRMLRRCKATVLQSQCNKEGRFENVQDAFEWQLSRDERKALQGKRLLLVDDVMTTGATLIAVAKVIAQAKPDALKAIVLARV